MTLLEREPHLRELATALADAVSGRGRLVWVSGEAGIGKTALVESFARAQREHVRVLWGACDALFTPRPLGPLHDMAAQVQGNLPTLLSSDANRATIFSTILVELQSRPTIAVVEDAHWADEATLDLIKYLGRRIPRTRALLIVTYRDDELDQKHPLRTVLGDLATTTATRRLLLAPLSVGSVRALIGDRPLDAAALCQQTGGNPFFVTEVIANESGGLPATVRDAVLARAARLSPSARAVLEAAAVIGPRLEAWLLAAVTGAEAGAVDQSLAAGLLLTHGDGFAFRHELARQAVLDSISPLHRTALHRMTLDALRVHPTTRNDLARLAHHAESAGDREAILEFAPAAARQATAARAHRAASDLYALALRFASALPLVERARAWESLAHERGFLDSRSETIAAWRTAAELWREANRPERYGNSLANLAAHLAEAAQKDDAEQAIAAALAVLEPLPPDESLVLAYRIQASLRLYSGENAQAIALAEKALSVAQRLENANSMTAAYMGLGLCWIGTDSRRACKYLERGLTLARGLDTEGPFASLCGNLGSIYCELYEFREAERVLAQGIAFAAERDLDRFQIFMQAWQALMYVYQGRWNEAADLATQVLQHPSLSPISRIPALVALGRMRSRRGNPNAEATLDEALDLGIRSGNLQRIGIQRAARAEGAWLADNRELTLEHARAAYDIVMSKHHPWLTGELAFWRWRAGDEVMLPEWTAKPFALHISGDWRGAADEWARLGCPYEQARALADGDLDAQIKALEIFDRLGARPAADALREKMRSAGARSVPRGPRSATRQNPFGLTARQLEILGLLVENLTNAEIAARLHISPKTVDHHVTTVLAKLDVTSRETAAEVARQRHLVPPPPASLK